MKRLAFVAVSVAAPLVATVLAGTASADSYDVDELTSFTSPSGNIGCYIEPGYVRCDIRERDWAPPPKAADCPDMTGWGQGLQLRAGRPAGFVCAGDTALTDGDALEYGDTITAGSIECRSEESGISCWDVQYGGEFEISREGYHLP